MKKLERSSLGSPIIYQNDRRRMKHLEQDGKNCGQTCVAMVSGKSLKQIEELMDNEQGTFRVNLKLACLALGVPVVGSWSDKVCYPDNPWPSTCLMRVTDRGQGHIIVRHGNMFYDPSGTSFYKLPDNYEFQEYLMIESEFVWVEMSEGKYQGDSLILCKAS